MRRATDFALVVLVMYGVAALVPALPAKVGLIAYFVHALAWRAFHSFGLGTLLDKQSKEKWFVRHYLKHYHYRSSDGKEETIVKRATEEAFGNWQVIYNISLVMTHGMSSPIERYKLMFSVFCRSCLEDVPYPQ